MADAADSKSAEGDFVWVQVPSPALRKQKVVRLNYLFCFLEQSVP